MEPHRERTVSARNAETEGSISALAYPYIATARRRRNIPIGLHDEGCPSAPYIHPSGAVDLAMIAMKIAAATRGVRGLFGIVSLTSMRRRASTPPG